VFATAIQGGLTVYDLEAAELAYAPQFGSAKDPVNLAGFVAANTLRGGVRNAQPDDLGDSLLLDVRTPDEHRAGAIAGSILMPLDDLRDRYRELPTDRPVVTYCQVGQRGYNAARFLMQRGYDVRNLVGGFATYRAVHAYN
jgi:rhodanese-related sulfurtransferase